MNKRSQKLAKTERLNSQESLKSSMSNFKLPEKENTPAFRVTSQVMQPKKEIIHHLLSSGHSRRESRKEIASSPIIERGLVSLSPDEEPESDRNTYDIDLVFRELKMAKQKLQESQSRIVSTTKELSKAQHENSQLDLQIKRLEMKCQEMNEKVASDQMKINELQYQNKQLSAEVSKFRAEQGLQVTASRDSLEKLRRTFHEAEKQNSERKNIVLFNVRKSKMLLLSLRNILDEHLSPGIRHSCGQLSNAIHDHFEKISAAFGEAGLTDLTENNSEEMKIIQSLNSLVRKYESENEELNNEVIRLREDLKLESEKAKELLPQYHESLAKMKKGVAAMRERIKELEEENDAEREDFERQLASQSSAYEQVREENDKLKEMRRELDKIIEKQRRTSEEQEKKMRKMVEENSNLYDRLNELQETLRKQETLINTLQRGKVEDLPSETSVYTVPSMSRSVNSRIETQVVPGHRKNSRSESNHEDLLLDGLNELDDSLSRLMGSRNSRSRGRSNPNRKRTNSHGNVEFVAKGEEKLLTSVHKVLEPFNFKIDSGGLNEIETPNLGSRPVMEAKDLIKKSLLPNKGNPAALATFCDKDDEEIKDEIENLDKEIAEIQRCLESELFRHQEKN